MSALLDSGRKGGDGGRRALGLCANCGNNIIAGGEREGRAQKRPAERFRDHALERSALMRQPRREWPRGIGRAVPHLLAPHFRFHLSPWLLRHGRPGPDAGFLRYGD